MMIEDTRNTTIARDAMIVQQLLNTSASSYFVEDNSHNETHGIKSQYDISNKLSNSHAEGYNKKRIKEFFQIIQIHVLSSRELKKPIDATVEIDDDSYIAQTVDFPLYATGETPSDAISSLKCEIETLYYELQEDDNFSEEWLNYKNFLNKIIK